MHKNNAAMILSACGLKCDECEFFNKTCTGCHMVKGSTFWAKGNDALKGMPSVRLLGK